MICFLLGLIAVVFVLTTALLVGAVVFRLWSGSWPYSLENWLSVGALGLLIVVLLPCVVGLLYEIGCVLRGQ